MHDPCFIYLQRASNVISPVSESKKKSVSRKNELSVHSEQKMSKDN